MAAAIGPVTVTTATEMNERGMAHGIGAELVRARACRAVLRAALPTRLLTAVASRASADGR